MSEHMGALAKALASAQLEMKDARRDATNPHYKNRYATLAAVREAVTAPLAKHGLAVTQTFEPHGADGVCIVTTLLHESGVSVVSRLFIPVQKKDAQGYGSAITYGRRYSLAAIVGIASDDDDDAEAAVGRDGIEKAEQKVKTQTTSDEAEVALTRLFDLATTVEYVAAAEAAAAKAVQAGELTDAARARLRKVREKAVSRVSGAS